MRGILISVMVLVTFGLSPTANAQPTRPLAPWVNDKHFGVVFDMYWRARLLGRYAGNRMCALKDRVSYDSPESPYRPLDQRLTAASNRINELYPKALDTIARPYMMPPSQMNCDDQKSAWESIFAFETAVTAVERLLDGVKRIDGAVEGK